MNGVGTAALVAAVTRAVSFRLEYPFIPGPSVTVVTEGRGRGSVAAVAHCGKESRRGDLIQADVACAGNTIPSKSLTRLWTQPKMTAAGTRGASSGDVAQQQGEA
jgi:hypothetical protein